MKLDDLEQPFEERLRNNIRATRGRDVKRVAILSFRALQLYRIGILQAELVEKQKDVVERAKDGTGTEGESIDKLLQRYGK